MNENCIVSLLINFFVTVTGVSFINKLPHRLWPKFCDEVITAIFVVRPTLRSRILQTVSLSVSVSHTGILQERKVLACSNMVLAVPVTTVTGRAMTEKSKINVNCNTVLRLKSQMSRSTKSRHKMRCNWWTDSLYCHRPIPSWNLVMWRQPLWTKNQHY